MRRTAEEAEQTRQSLLETALKIFSEEGFQAARLQDIARAAGVTRGAIYHHFEGKADLYRTLVEEASGQASQVIQAAIARGGTFTDVCRAILVDSLTLLETDSRFQQAVALSLFKTGVSPDLADLEARRIEEAAGFIDGIAGFMAQGMAGGEVRSDFSPHSMARAFVAYQNGLAWLWLANGRFFSLSDDAPHLADLFLNGIRPR